MRRLAKARGEVYLIGAGPGDPDLITVKGLACLRRAEVVLHDRLIHPHLLQQASPAAEIIDVGKLPGHHHRTQAEINALLVVRAEQGKIVVRLKGGPLCLRAGRGGMPGVSASGDSLRDNSRCHQCSRRPRLCGYPSDAPRIRERLYRYDRSSMERQRGRLEGIAARRPTGCAHGSRSFS